jgi:hypothetical protein
MKTPRTMEPVWEPVTGTQKTPARLKTGPPDSQRPGITHCLEHKMPRGSLMSAHLTCLRSPF